MITTKIKTVLTASGCSLVLYDQSQLANLYTDQSDQTDIIGLILMPPTLELNVAANAIHEHYNPLTIEILKQARLEDKGETNELILEALLEICKQVIHRLIQLEEFKKVQPVSATRILESHYDANVIGWSLPFNLFYLENRTIEPCL